MIFGKKLNRDLHTTFNKMDGNFKTFGRKYGGDIKKGLNLVNEYSKPILTAGSIIQPEFAPAFAGIGAGLEASARVGDIMFADDQPRQPREYKPRLER